MSKTENVWANEGGTPGMPICKIEVGSEAWDELVAALTLRDVPYIRISASEGNLKVKVFEGIWSWPLDVEAPEAEPLTPHWPDGVPIEPASPS